MCTGIELALVGGAAVNAGSSMYGGRKAMEAGYKQKALNELDARNEISAAQNVVKLIRRQKQSVQGAARAAYAASGVQVDSGTADFVDKDIGARAAEDMYQTLIEGSQRAERLRQQGRQAAEAGNDALRAGTLDAISAASEAGYEYSRSTALGSFYQARGWK